MKIGDQVKLKGTGECGVISWVWDDEYGDSDCYVTFFGRHFPKGKPRGKPRGKPYVLRYYATSLILVK